MANQTLVHNARTLRKLLTPWEHKLWRLLRSRRFFGYKFRRQFSIDHYIVDFCCLIVDFCCLEKRLIIELDGGQHNQLSNIDKDNDRDEYLKSQNFRILRVWNNELDQNLEGVTEKILSLLKK